MSAPTPVQNIQWPLQSAPNPQKLHPSYNSLLQTADPIQELFEKRKLHPRCAHYDAALFQNYYEREGSLALRSQPVRVIQLPPSIVARTGVYSLN